MKKSILLLLSILVFTACKNTKEDTSKENETTVIGADGLEKTAKQNDGLTLLKGNFLYYADAAVLQTHKDVYGVVVDDKMHELNNKAKSFKNEATDMVPVEIRGKISPKPEGAEGWPFVVEIKEILNVTQPSAEDSDVIKLSN